MVGPFTSGSYTVADDVFVVVVVAVVVVVGCSVDVVLLFVVAVLRDGWLSREDFIAE